MKDLYYREIRHIVANYSISNRATGYPENSKSVTADVIRKLIKLKIVENVSVKNNFMFVLPTKSFLIKIQTKVFTAKTTAKEISE